MKAKKKKCARCEEEKFIYKRIKREGDFKALPFCRECTFQIEKPKPLKRTELKRTSKPTKQSKKANNNHRRQNKPRSSIKNRTEKNQQSMEKERAAMLKAWTESPPNCAECQRWLGNEEENMNPYCMAHIISKGANPALRADSRNIIKLCPDCHHEFDCGERSKMKIFEKTEKIRAKLKGEDLKK